MRRSSRSHSLRRMTRRHPESPISRTVLAHRAEMGISNSCHGIHSPTRPISSARRLLKGQSFRIMDTFSCCSCLRQTLGNPAYRRGGLCLRPNQPCRNRRRHRPSRHVCRRPSGSTCRAAAPNGRVIVFHNRLPFTFHPKVYLFKSPGAAELLIGSGNLAEGGLFTNYEASLRLTLDLADPDQATILQSIEHVLDICARQSSSTSHVLMRAGNGLSLCSGEDPLLDLVA